MNGWAQFAHLKTLQESTLVTFKLSRKAFIIARD
jgi:hypothetical protein